ncbi:alpha/beta hydrolase [Streptomyces oceani]|uniref:Serine aminopeptidase S33 domain-containing protein n=1 Tax=Streptomyces oceani TaxID=1075402 RepID=A0A1E7JYY0_9ACTN|nr:hypothetical protein [Streptomyces oceani]OEU96862.1 hypothetical protein AN216_18025 [Streptomyces oceani]
MRPQTTAALTATTVLGAGAVALWAGRHAADLALKPARARPARTPVPAGFTASWLTVHACTAPTEPETPGGRGGPVAHGRTDDPVRTSPATPGRIVLTRSLAAELPGHYGLAGRDGRHAAVGPVLDDPSGSPDTLVRRLDHLPDGAFSTGARVRLTPLVRTGSPRDALGADYTEVDVPGPDGSLPAWFVPGGRSTWVIAVHGLGGTREQALTVLPLLRRLRLPVLSLGYRGDPGAPRPEHGVGHLGATEWPDVDAALRYATRHDAARIVLYGWSTGATMALRAVAESVYRERLCGLVLDSPVLDRRATLRALAASRGVPRMLLPLAERAAEGRGLRLSAATDSGPSPCPPVPTLLLHGPDDTIAPWDASRALAARFPGRVTLHTVRRARHAAMWNVDPSGYEESVRRFLTSVI